ncbi:amidohydrolase family protein [Peribacillus frigoritolerans]|nr:amidohydrolase family protein [Peribacillus frigoritolerans]
MSTVIFLWGKIVELTSTNPAKLFGLYPHKGIIAVDSDADLAIVNLNKSFELKKEDLFYRHQQSPYVGRTFKGQVTTTIVNGAIVFEKWKHYHCGKKLKSRIVKL